jgi:glycosyltransferase involved in cell wall biosynthesis
LGTPVTVCKVWDADYPWDVRVEKVCRSLGREHEVHLVSRNTKRRSSYERHDGLHIHRLPVAPWAPDRLNAVMGFPVFFNPLWIRAVWQTVRRCRAKALIVRDVPLALTALLVGRAAGIPVVLDMAENYPAMIRDVWAAGRARIGDRLVRNPRLVRLVERISVRHADHILVVVDESRERLAKMGVPTSKMTVVMNTPPLERGAEHGREGDDRLEASRRDELVLVYLGLLEAPRGLGTAIQAMREVRRRFSLARLVIIGSGRDEERFREEARIAGVTDCVEFRGWVEYREALGCLSRCDVGLVPHHATESWQTTIPNKLFDYMSLGKAVIVSNARPTERIVTEERCGLVFRDRDVTSLAEAIVAMGDPALREACGRRGREAIRRRYNWEADERRLLGAIRRVTDPSGSRDDEDGVVVGALPKPGRER